MLVPTATRQAVFWRSVYFRMSTGWTDYGLLITIGEDELQCLLGPVLLNTPASHGHSSFIREFNLASLRICGKRGYFMQEPHDTPLGMAW
jgi:hypothetical protein